jgi:hypothetical protein
MVVSYQGARQCFEYSSFVFWLMVGGRSCPEIVEASEKERIETMEAGLAQKANKKGQIRV